MTEREIENRARELYERSRRPNEVPFDRRDPVIKEVWRSLARVQLRREAEDAR